MADEQGTAPQADGVATPHVTDNIPVQTNTPEPVVVAKEPIAESAPAAATPDTPAADTEEARAPVQKLPAWAEKKIADAAFSEREAKREAKRLADELANERAARATPPAAPTQADVDTVNANAPAGGFKSQADLDAAVTAEVNRRAQADRINTATANFDAACNAAYEKGTGEFKEEFDAAVKNLGAVGAMQRDILEMVLDTEEPHKVLYELGRDPAKAAALLDMTPAKRAMEIARLSVVPAKKAANPLSQAPAPVRPVEGTARASTDPRDDDDDDAWFAKRNAQLKARA